MFTIAGPDAGDTDGNAGNTDGKMFALGSCNMDQFTVTGTGGPYPVICGINDNQHMIVDTDGTTCVTATFSFGLANQQRNYEIHVIQYDRLNPMGGPPNCLQYYTGLTGTVRSFNWVNVMSTHLANQFYDVCIRPEATRCVTCWSPTISGAYPAGKGTTAAKTVGSFGVSNGPSTNGAGKGKSGAGVGNCPGDTDTFDFVFIRRGEDSTAGNIGPGNGINRNIVSGEEVKNPSVFCGRYLNFANDQDFDATVCTRASNFRLGVNFDSGENVANSAVEKMATDEASGEVDGGANVVPLGTQGFSLGFAQMPC